MSGSPTTSTTPQPTGTRVRAVRFATKPVPPGGSKDSETGLIRQPPRPGQPAGDVLTTDDNITVPPGTMGTIIGHDDAGTLFVEWDNGHCIGLLRDVDQWDVVEG